MNKRYGLITQSFGRSQILDRELKQLLNCKCLLDLKSDPGNFCKSLGYDVNVSERFIKKSEIDGADHLATEYFWIESYKDMEDMETMEELLTNLFNE